MFETNYKFDVGDKVWYKTLQAGWVKAVVRVRSTSYMGNHNGMALYMLKITSKNNPIFPRGYITESMTDLHLSKR